MQNKNLVSTSLTTLLLISMAGSAANAAPRISCRDRLTGVGAPEAAPSDPSVVADSPPSNAVMTLSTDEQALFPAGWKPYRMPVAFDKLLDRKEKLKKEIETLTKRLSPGFKSPSSSSSGGYLSVLMGATNFAEPPKAPLTPLERMKIQTEAESKKAELKSLNSEIEARKAVEKKRLITSLRGLSNHVDGKSLLSDFLTTASIYRLPKDQIVTFAIGSMEAKPTLAQRREVTKVIADFKERGYFIMFDGDSNLSPVMEDAAGDRGISLRSGPARSSRKPGARVTIANDFLRMTIMKHAEQIMVSLDSPAGVALLLTGKESQTAVWNGGGQHDSSVNEWVESLSKEKRNLGIASISGRNYDDLGRVLKLQWKTDDGVEDVFPKLQLKSDFEPSPALDSFSYEMLMHASEFVETSLRARVRNKNVGGSVIFGSSGFDEKSVQLTYDTAFALGTLGVPVVTGGAGGTMLVANKGAFDSGGLSIGVPITNKALVSNEDVTSSDVQTATIDTPSYEVRIPTLLLGRPLVVFAPGGSGTIKELGAVLMQIQRAQTSGARPVHYVFLDRSYYGPLVDWLKKLGLPTSFTSRLHIFDTIEEVQAFASLLKELEPKFATQTPPAKPRKAHTPFEIPKPMSDEDFGLFDWMHYEIWFSAHHLIFGDNRGCCSGKDL